MPSVLIALLRGVNVGPSKRVAMSELRALMEGLGYRDVRTILNSGNVVFSAPRTDPGEAASRVEEALQVSLGLSVRVTVIRAVDLEAAIEGNPLGAVASNPSRFLVGILAEPADRKKLAGIARQDWGEERIALGAARAVYLWMPDGVIKSKLNAAVSKAVGDGVTARTWATMLKLREAARAYTISSSV